MDIYYDPLDCKCKDITGGIKQNEKLILNIFGNASSCFLVLQKDGEAAEYKHMQRTAQGWQIALCLSDIGLYFYYFEIDGRRGGCGKFRKMVFDDGAPPYQLIVSRADFSTPDWFKGGIMYQIFPDRFFSSGNVIVGEGKWLHKSWKEQPEYRMNAEGKVLNNDFFGGNLQGIIKKLDHLKNLRVTALYLNPVFQAYSNHRYDTGDYKQIDPMLGSEADFEKLTKECEARGIRVILDGVFNHTGEDSRYFNKYGHYDSLGAYQSKNSQYYAWYTFSRFPDKYDSWWGIESLPAVNESCPAYVDFITGKDGVLRYWMKYPLGGYRLDVADELPDSFIEKIRATVKASDSDALVIGEVWEDASNKIAYGQRRRYLQGNELDSIMNYPLKDAIIHFISTGKTDNFRQTVFMLLDNYPKCVLDSLMNILGTHDTVRILTALGGIHVAGKDAMSVTVMDEDTRASALKKLKAAAVLQFTLFGVPCIYYGDEVGMEGYADPFCRMPFPWDDIDEDLLFHYKRLAKIRSKMSVFREGRYRELYADSQCIVYERRSEKEVAVVCMNCGYNKFELKFDGTLYDLLKGGAFAGSYTLKPESYTILGNKCIN